MPTPLALIGSLEAAEALGVSRATFNRWVALGRIIPVVNMDGVSGARLYDPGRIAAYREQLRGAA